MVIGRMMRWVRGDETEQDEIPECADHHVPMVLFKKAGKPARFTDQETETYYLLFVCPVEGCGNSAERRRIRTQIPVPGERTERPDWATHDRKSI